MSAWSPVPRGEPDTALLRAFTYVALRWRVLALHGVQTNGSCTCAAGSECGTPGAHPLDGLSLSDATTNSNQLTAWWKAHPHANVGIVTGEASGLAVVVIDENLLDPRALPVVDALLATGTPTVRRSTGGTVEILFEWSHEADTGKELTPGFDYATGEMLVVAPPSRLGVGEVRWEGDARAVAKLPMSYTQLVDLLMAAGADAAPRETAHVNEPTPLGRLSTSAEPVVIAMSAIEARSVTWLLPDYIPLGELTMLGGHPSAGKSAVMTDLVARVTTGAPSPLGDGPMPRGGAIIMCREEDPASAIRPRLEAAGADVSRVFMLNDIREPHGGERGVRVPYDVDLIEQACRDHDVRLVVLDPITDFLHRTDANAEQDVRRALLPLVQLARRLEMAVVFVRHLSKRDQANALHQGIGSIGFGAVARAGLLVEKVGDQRVLRATKSSCCPDGVPALGFRIVSAQSAVAGSVGRIEWLNRIAPEVPQPALSAIERAKVFIMEQLAAGPVLASVMLERARAAGVAERNLREAKKDSGVVSRGRPIQWFPPPQGCKAASPSGACSVAALAPDEA